MNIRITSGRAGTNRRRAGRFRKAAAGLLAMALVLFGAGLSFAKINDNGHFNPNRQGGFIGLSPVLVSVEQAGHLRDGRQVRLRGHLLHHERGAVWLFKDKTGSLPVNIHTEIWRGQQVGPEDLVEIWGEISTNSAGKTLEATRLRKF